MRVGTNFPSVNGRCHLHGRCHFSERSLPFKTFDAVLKSSRTDVSLREKLVRGSLMIFLRSHVTSGVSVLFTRWRNNLRVRGEPAEPEPAHSSSADTKPKSIRKPTGWNFFFQSVAVSLFCISQNVPAFLSRIKRFFEQSHMLLFPRFLYHSTARSQGTTWKKAGIGQVSKWLAICERNCR